MTRLGDDSRVRPFFTSSSRDRAICFAPGAARFSRRPRRLLIFLACLALGLLAITGVGSITRSLAARPRRKGPHHSRRRYVLRSRSARGDARQNAVLGRARPAHRRRADARHGPANRRRRRRSSRSRRSMPAIRPRARWGWSPPQNLAAALAVRDGAYGVAADATLAARLDLKTGERLQNRRRELRSARHPDERARQACRRHRLRPARADVGRRAAGDGAAPAGRAGHWLYRLSLRAGRRPSRRL